jgi:hypothetical protein
LNKPFSTLIIVAFFLLSALPLYSQIVVEEDTKTTDTIDIFRTVDTDAENAKSPKLAMLMNILVPGLGHQYLDMKKRAFVYFSTEVALMFGMVMCEGYSKKIFSDSRSYAFQFAGISSTRDPDDEYWRIIGDDFFQSYDQYNAAIENNRDFDMKYVQPDERWQWEADFYQDRYRKLRQDAMNFHVVSSFFLGAVLLNHVVAFIDVRIASRRQTNYSHNKTTILPYYASTNKTLGLTVSRTF